MEMTFTDTTEKKSCKYFGVIIFLIVLLGGIIFGYQYFFGHKQGEVLEKNFSENPETFNQDVAKEFTEPIGVFQEHTADGKEIVWRYSFSSAKKRRLAEWTGRGSVRPILQDGKLMYLDYGES